MALIRANMTRRKDGSYQLKFRNDREWIDAADLIRKMDDLPFTLFGGGMHNERGLVFEGSVTFEDITSKLHDKLALE